MNTSYSDLADRPLLLTQLLLIYSRESELPQLPRDIYEILLYLLLRDWDQDRDIARKSKYSNFGPLRKQAFLSKLSFRLMYGKKKIRFHADDLVDVYQEICRDFTLPEDEAKQVAAEMETHNGILISSGHNHYEFSHLSMQEYLCANYLVKQPPSTKLKAIIEIRPAPVAIMIALSTEPGEWFAQLLFEPDLSDALYSNIRVFLNRLILEYPIFSPSVTLGFALFQLHKSVFCTHDEEILKVAKKFYALPGIKESISMFFVGDKHTRIVREKPRSRKLLALRDLEIDSTTGNRFRRTLSTNNKELRDFAQFAAVRDVPSKFGVLT